MSRAITLTLQVGLLLSAVAGILFAVRIILQQAIGGSWYWAGAMAADSPELAHAPIEITHLGSGIWS